MCEPAGQGARAVKVYGRPSGSPGASGAILPPQYPANNRHFRAPATRMTALAFQQRISVQEIICLVKKYARIFSTDPFAWF